MPSLLPEGAANYTPESVIEFAKNIIDIVALGTGIAAIIVLIWASIQYLNASISGSDKAGSAKTMIMWAVVGIIVILLSRVILIQIFNLIGPTQTPTLP